MIVILSADEDPEAPALIHQRADATLVRPSDLSDGGWVSEFPDAGPIFSAQAGPKRVNDVHAVLVRLPAVTAADLPHFVEEDRDYAAAEMTAFLAYWLTALPCRVVNRPTPAYLLGPPWTGPEWIARAAAQGIPTIDVIETSTGGSSAPPADHWCTVVGNRVLGGDCKFHKYSLALARLAKVELLGAAFAGEKLVGVTLRPPLRDPLVQNAVFQLLGEQ